MSDTRFRSIMFFRLKLVPKSKISLLLISLLFCFFLVYIKYFIFHNYFHVQSFLYIDDDNESRKTYLVNTPVCQILNWSPFSDEVLPLYVNKTGKKIKCRYSFKSFLRASRIDGCGLKIENLNNSKASCYATPILRHAINDNSIQLAQRIGPLATINYLNNQFVKVNCFSNEKPNVSIYEEVIPLIPKLKTIRNKTETNNSILPNVLMIGLDSISRLNFWRHFTYTKKLLKEVGFKPMYGYTKVADNTFVNLVPMLTGEFVDQFWNESISDKTYLNSLPFIWKKYENKGHVTFFGEDATYMSTFNFLKRGFKEQPTYYYLRPFSLAIENFIHNNCYKDKMEMEIYLNYLYDFIKSVDEKNEKYFALMFMARLTHDELNNAGYADIPMHNFLFKLITQNMLKNTVVIFFSDHGLRFGPIRQTLTGKIEERLPFMFVYLPQSLNNYQNNLTINQNRLTTPFDIHAMLEHLVNGESVANLKHGLSLLEEIPETRSCSDASILEHWCVCQVSQPFNNMEVITPMALYVIETLNQLLQYYREKCQFFKLSRVLSAYQQHISDKVLRFKQSVNDVVNRHVIFSEQFDEYIKHYLITVEAKPEKTLFEATVKINELNNVISIVGDISRINKYGPQMCINNSHLQKYCLCT